MIGLDTNVLARFLLQDHKEQALLAEDAIADTSSNDSKNFINIIVLCELLWLFELKYGYSRKHLSEVIEKLLFSDDFFIEDSKAVLDALSYYKSTKVGFADILIAVRNKKAGCDATLTFDKVAAKLDEFILLA